MKYVIFYILFLGLASSCVNKTPPSNDDSNPNQEVKKKPLSPHETAMAMVGDAHVHIDYSSPGVRGRTIFGDLLPYGELWRAGAGDATSIETNKDLIIDGQTLEAGKYGIYMIPNQDRWTLIFNTTWDVHGTDKYKEQEDVLRINVVPKTLSNFQEHLKYRVDQIDGSSGIISMAWESSKVEIPFQIK